MTRNTICNYLNKNWLLFHFQINDTEVVRGAVENFFTLAETNERIRTLYGNAVLDISSDELTFNSRETLRKICSFLDVECYDSYLNKVERLLNGHSTISRNLVAWREEDKDLITTKMAKYSFLQYSTFDDVFSFSHWIKGVLARYLATLWIARRCLRINRIPKLMI